ncbi:hypothetical protein EMIT0158MI4_150156 [Burkholderia ambifaria]
MTAGRIGDAEHGAQAFGMAGAGMVPDTGAADGFRMRLYLQRACTRFRHACRCDGNRYGRPNRAVCD